MYERNLTKLKVSAIISLMGKCARMLFLNAFLKLIIVNWHLFKYIHSHGTYKKNTSLMLLSIICWLAVWGLESTAGTESFLFHH